MKKFFYNFWKEDKELKFLLGKEEKTILAVEYIAKESFIAGFQKGVSYEFMEQNKKILQKTEEEYCGK